MNVNAFSERASQGCFEPTLPSVAAMSNDWKTCSRNCRFGLLFTNTVFAEQQNNTAHRVQRTCPRSVVLDPSHLEQAAVVVLDTARNASTCVDLCAGSVLDRVARNSGSLCARAGAD
jgi:hypothetical protein